MIQEKNREQQIPIYPRKWIFTTRKGEKTVWATTLHEAISQLGSLRELKITNVSTETPRRRPAYESSGHRAPGFYRF